MNMKKKYLLFPEYQRTTKADNKTRINLDVQHQMNSTRWWPTDEVMKTATSTLFH